VLVKGEKAIAGFSEKTFTAFFEWFIDERGVCKFEKTV
jgi:hypothetical protein